MAKYNKAKIVGLTVSSALYGKKKKESTIRDYARTFLEEEPYCLIEVTVGSSNIQMEKQSF